MSKSFDFNKRNFENLESGADYFVSLLKDYNYIEFCKIVYDRDETVYRIGVKKLADDVFVVTDGTMDLEIREELPFQNCQLCRTITDVGKYVFDKINEDYYTNLICEYVVSVSDYFKDRYAYVENM